jgi:DNA-binding beta-propeller fold protein YncE
MGTGRWGFRVGGALAVVAVGLSVPSLASGSAGGQVAKVATVKVANLGLFDLTWYGTPFGKPTVYLSDQAGIEVFNAKTNAYLGSFGRSDFIPFGAGAPACGVIGGTGPNGILTLTIGGSNQVWAGNGNSTVNVFTLSAPGSGTLAASISTRGQCRADEFSYDPAQHLLLITNPSETANYASFISVHANPKLDKVVGQIAYPNAVGGLEQSVYDPANGDFYLNVVQTGSANAAIGSVDVISPTTKRVIGSFPVIGCGPAGLALDPRSGELLLGCSSHNALMTMDAKTGAILHSITGVSGTDEVAYDPVSQSFVAPGVRPDGTPVLAEISGRTGQLVASAPLPAGGLTHSIAAGGSKAFVPILSVGMSIYSVR